MNKIEKFIRSDCFALVIHRTVYLPKTDTFLKDVDLARKSVHCHNPLTQLR